VPLLIHAVKTAESQPEHALLLLCSQFSSFLDQWKPWQLSCILADFVQNNLVVTLKER
jgi:hypothetical protein